MNLKCNYKMLLFIVFEDLERMGKLRIIFLKQWKKQSDPEFAFGTKIENFTAIKLRQQLESEELPINLP
jgi:hypothetical protein